MPLKGRVALVTGGSSGIGQATINSLLQNGVKAISILDIQETPETEELGKKYDDCEILFIKTDVSCEEQVREAFRKTIERFSGVDIVVHSAGIFDDSDWRKQIHINVNGAIIVNMVSLELMGKDKGGKGGILVNVSSEAGYIAHPLMPMYAATKAAVLSFSRCIGTPLFFENTGITVITVCPSGTLTPLTPHTTEKFIELDFVRKVGQNFTNMEYFQKPESAGKCVVDAIIDGENGSIWLSKEDLPGRKLNFNIEPKLA